MRLLAVTLLFAAVGPSFATELYPNLTLPEARCPETPSTLYPWFLTNLGGMLRCLLPIFYDTDYPEFDMDDVCREKHVDAKWANLNTPEWKYFQSIFSRMGRNYRMCTVPAYPRVLESYNFYHNRNRNVLRVDESKYRCEGEGWIMYRPCLADQPYCYKIIKNDGNSFANEAPAEFNYCGMVEPNSFMASAHCDDEYRFMTENARPGVQIGLYLPRYATWSRFSSWKWTDQSPADYLPWQPGTPDNFHGIERVAHLQTNGNLNDVPYDFYKGQNLYCKKLATKKRAALDVVLYKYNMCRKEPASHWNHRCPSGSDSWKIVESEAGVHCYDFVTVPYPLTRHNLNHELCSKLHISAKLASFHNNIQLGFVVDLQYETSDINNLIVGMQCKTKDNCEWLDKTDISMNFFDSDEPKYPSVDSFVKVEWYTMPSPCFEKGCEKRRFERPLFSTRPMRSAHQNMRVVCKVDAVPIHPCPPMPISTGLDTYENTKCKEGWEQRRFCDMTYCYKIFNVPSNKQNYKAVYENNICASESAKAHLASIHCLEEHYYVQGLPAAVAIGLHIPKRLRVSDKYFDVNDWQWTDGSAFDFVGWNRYSLLYSADVIQEPMFPLRDQPTFDGTVDFFAFNKYDEQRSGWTNINTGLNRVLCKEKAAWRDTVFPTEV